MKLFYEDSLKSNFARFNLTPEDLYNNLEKIDAEFLEFLKHGSIELYDKLVESRATSIENSQLIIEVSAILENFILELFGLENKTKQEAERVKFLYEFKRNFVQRKALKKYSKEQVAELQYDLQDEYEFAKATIALPDDLQDEAMKYAAWCSYFANEDSVLFSHPKKLDLQHLVDLEKEDFIYKESDEKLDFRAGFHLADHFKGHNYSIDQANYCIYCHEQSKDSCSHGIKDKDGSFKVNSAKINLHGCPLEEKISEMNMTKAAGGLIAPLAIAMIDNPLLAATGHRICNDCMKSCIYQKQEPVNIPHIETQVLKDVLIVDYGFEIYSLLTKWNPLNVKRPYPQATTNYKVLVSGMGPSGFSLAYHLAQEGHDVVAIDGAKIEPLPSQLVGHDEFGEMTTLKLIKHYDELTEKLEERVNWGFGGVAEYGITVRWDKNYLKVIRIILERMSNFKLYDGVRFGSNITYDQAFELGFDHVALCHGAGRPNLLGVENELAKGVRTASDFLMSLQLTGAAREDLITNLNLELPAIVIGGGLTAFDTAVEAMNYYPIMVKKFTKRFEILEKKFGAEYITNGWSIEEKQKAATFVEHAKIFDKCGTDKAKLVHELQKLGGVTVVYRSSLQDCPAYRLNHEEVELSMKEGIYFAENLSPASFNKDDNGNVCGVVCKDKENQDKLLPAKSVFLAIGTNPNNILAREDSEHFKLNGKYFTLIDETGDLKESEKIAKPKDTFVLMSKNSDNKFVSFFGDMHPAFSGNVVKAMASAKKGFPVINSALKLSPPVRKNLLNNNLTAIVKDVTRLTNDIVEVTIYAPLAAKNFQPGQFYRLQNYEKNSRKSFIENVKTTLLMEGLALTGAECDPEKGLISLITLEMGGSSNLCALLQPGEKVVLMGPTGHPTEIKSGETVCLIGGGLGNAVLFSIGAALKAHGSKVIYFAGYRKLADRYKIKQLQAASDVIIYACDEGKFEDHSYSIQGNIIEAILSYAKGELGEQAIKLQDVDRIIAIGSDKMMKAVSIARHNILKPYLKSSAKAFASINSPMQCMMKEICAQCLQRHIDPVTGTEHYIYSCVDQDQAMDLVDFDFLNSRLSQNSLHEKLTRKWLELAIK